MAEAKARSRVEELTESFARRARANGRSVAEEVEWVIARGDKFSPEEGVAVSRYFHSRFDGILPALSLDEIRDGLM
jgi:hypothetical protein